MSARPLLGVHPFVHIAGKDFESPAMWAWLNRTLESGGTVWITDRKPDGVLPSVAGDGDQPKYPHVWARQIDPRTESIGSGPLWLWCHPSGRPWTAFSDGFSEIQGENNIIPLYQSPTQKYGGVQIVDGQPVPFAPWSGERKFWQDFAVASAVIVGAAVGLSYAAGSIGATVPAVDGVVGLSPWEIATGGMAEGMGTGGVIASTPLVSAPVAAQSATGFTVPVLGSSVAPVAESAAGAAGVFDVLAGTAKDAAQTASGLAGAAGAVRASVNAIQAAANGPTPGQRAAAQQATADNNLYLAAIVVAGFVLIG